MLIPSYFQASDRPRFVFHSPKTSTKTTVLTAGVGIGTAYATHYALASLWNCLKCTNIPVNMFATLRVPITSWFHLEFSAFGPLSIRNPNIIKALMLGTAGSIGALAALLTYAYQPEGKFSTAQYRLSKAVENDVFNELMSAQQNLLNNIDNNYIDSMYPRVAAYHDFMRFHTSLKEAAEWLKQAKSATNDKAFIYMIDDYTNIVHYYLDNISSCMSIIRNEPDWLKQLKGYEMQKTREAQEKLAIATQMAALNNHHYVHIH